MTATLAIRTYQKRQHVVHLAMDRDLGKYVFVPAVRPVYDTTRALVARGCWDASQLATMLAELGTTRKRDAETRSRVQWAVWEAFQSIMNRDTAVSNDNAFAIACEVGAALLSQKSIGGYDATRIIVAKLTPKWRTDALGDCRSSVVASALEAPANVATVENISPADFAEWSRARDRAYETDRIDAMAAMRAGERVAAA